MLGTMLCRRVTMMHTIQSQKVRTLIKQDFDQASDASTSCRKTSPTVAFRIERGQRSVQMYLSTLHFAPIARRICSLSVPCGFSEGLPVGLQISGPAQGEECILRVAYAYEQAMEWHRHKPSLKASPSTLGKEHLQ